MLKRPLDSSLVVKDVLSKEKSIELLSTESLCKNNGLILDSKAIALADEVASTRNAVLPPVSTAAFVGQFLKWRKCCWL
jgi:hypothetical protein